jgi:hypothetical protein
MCLELYNIFQEKWILELLFNDLLTWNNFFWTQRRILPLHLIVLGSDRNTPLADGDGSLAHSCYESGFDNSPMNVL